VLLGLLLLGPERKPPNRLGRLESEDFGVSEMWRAGLESANAIYWMIALGLTPMVGAPLAWIAAPVQIQLPRFLGSPLRKRVSNLGLL
jgi:hypothetical protein